MTALPNLNTYSYVGGNPVNFIDPIGLWSFNASLYAGVGGGITIGRDPTTGQLFYGGRLGIGVGGSVGIDTNGQRPGAEEANKSGGGCNNGTTYGTYYEAGGTVGPWSKNILQAAGGYDTGTGGSYRTPPGQGSVTVNPHGVSIGGAFGFEIVGH